MQAKVTISLKNGVLDPQAKAIHHAIESLGFPQVAQVVVKKQIILEFAQNQHCEQIAQQIAKDLLANPVIEEYEMQILDSTNTSQA
ncbi:phosphoribosylformylglycinamidine synthase subunit PurS [Helicobacter canis]|uniref:Phosphoribosylformylglycinamidine synthase subunit PurS n=1 Tax=Helicobacter canis TaxID=29419 RepID=A0A377J5Q0_9HELI|nr:phosphoribosylformylglycinamidine synthase subunit PurS [Helicobacter canis]STO97625.1 phosphoribosylformylglycinamidine synthase [Helicobacter canis]